MNLILKNVTYKIDSKKILDNINIELSTGLHALLGLNGSGKTTLLEIIVTIKKQTGGEVLYNNLSVKNNRLFLKDLGYMPQNQSLIQDFNIIQNLMYFGMLKGCKMKFLSAFIPQLLEKFNLKNLGKERVVNLSGGIKQKVMLLVTLINNPKILILDEPFNNLDEVERKNMYSLLKDISKNSIIILSTHLVEEIALISDNQIYLDKGTITE